MKILFMLPAAKGVYPPDAEAQRIATIKSYETSSIAIDVDFLPEASGFNPYGGQMGADEIARTHELAYQRAMQAAREGYDAFCPFGGVDAGVALSRERGLRIPCIGPGEANLLFCRAIGRRFASCAYLEGGEAMTLPRAEALDIAHLYVGETAIGIANSEFSARHDEVLERYRTCVESARALGAEVMGSFGQSICPMEFSARELYDATGMPAFDGIANQIALAQCFHGTGLAPSSVGVTPRS